MSNNKQGDVSIANVLAIIGLAAIGVITFFGDFLSSRDGSPIRGIVIAVVLVLMLGLLLIVMIKAKGSSEERDKWRLVMWGSLVLYVGIAIFGAFWNNNFFRLFAVAQSKVELQGIARDELSAIEKLYDSYNTQKEAAMDGALNQLKAYSQSGQYYYSEDPMRKFVHERIADADLSEDGLNDWYKVSWEVVNIDPLYDVGELGNEIMAWNYMRLPSLAIELDEAYGISRDQITNRIAEFSKNGLIPVISGGNGIPFKVDGVVSFNLPQLPALSLSKELRSKTDITVLGIIIFVVVHLLVLLNFIVAPDSGIVTPRNRKKSGNESSNIGLSL